MVWLAWLKPCPPVFGPGGFPRMGRLSSLAAIVKISIVSLRIWWDSGWRVVLLAARPLWGPRFSFSLGRGYRQLLMAKHGAGAKIKHPKLRGEWAELCFMVRAAEKGLQVSKPWGETARYDFAVERDGRFLRVQVKSTMFRDRGGYSCTVRGCRGPYEGAPFDFVAAYLIPEDLWYIIPEEMIRGQGSIAVYPQLKKSNMDGIGRLGICWGLGEWRFRLVRRV